jgi:hypothetical protein
MPLRNDTSEVRLALVLLERLRSGMLCLPDRAFVGFAMWRTAAGVDLVWRVRSNQVLPRQRRLKDGSYLSRLYPSPDHRHRDDGGTPVRIIEYRLDGILDA